MRARNFKYLVYLFIPAVAIPFWPDLAVVVEPFFTTGVKC